MSYVLSNISTDLTMEKHTIAAPPSQPINYAAMLLFVFPAFTLFGNILVCLSIFREKNLHSVTNYFIFSLALADILVAILVMPLAVYVEVNKIFVLKIHLEFCVYLKKDC